jgi:hypothetical protein
MSKNGLFVNQRYIEKDKLINLFLSKSRKEHMFRFPNTNIRIYFEPLMVKKWSKSEESDEDDIEKEDSIEAEEEQNTERSINDLSSSARVIRRKLTTTNRDSYCSDTAI